LLPENVSDGLLKDWLKWLIDRLVKKQCTVSHSGLFIYNFISLLSHFIVGLSYLNVTVHVQLLLAALTSCAQYAPAPLLPSGCRSASRRRTDRRPCRRQRSSSFPRFWPSDLESDVRVPWDVGYLYANLVFLGLSVLELFSMYATDVRQKHLLMPPP